MSSLATAAFCLNTSVVGGFESTFIKGKFGVIVGRAGTKGKSRLSTTLMQLFLLGSNSCP